ncbi:MAG: hypothetical protein JWQ94_2250 [Tardiphaga sp.]|jgi:hypothetical protein|nr:hypothetical protein [Tardiphaga sp.]
MSSIERLTAKRRLYTDQELYDLRCSMLRFARSFPPGSERNQHRQIALSLRALFRNAKWLRDHSVSTMAALP